MVRTANTALNAISDRLAASCTEQELDAAATEVASILGVSVHVASFHIDDALAFSGKDIEGRRSALDSALVALQDEA